MPSIVVKSFNGLKPVASPLLLENSDAQTAQNVRLTSGSLQSLNNSTTLKATVLAGPKTVYRFDPTGAAAEANYWLEFAQDTDLMRSPIAQDQWDRLYWTDGTNPPRMTPSSNAVVNGSPAASYLLGIPKPSTAITVASFSAPTTYTTVGRQYVLTLYNSTTLKESTAGTPFTVQGVDGQKVSLSNLTTDNRGDVGTNNKRLYRNISGTFRLVATILLATTTYDDTVTDASLAAATALPTALGSAPTSPAYAPQVSSPLPQTTASGISRSYLYTVCSLTVAGIVYTESPPSPANAVTADTTQTITVGALTNNNNGQFFRVYRKDAGATTYQLVQQVPVATTSITDVLATTILGDVLSTTDGPVASTPVTGPAVSAGSSSPTSTVNRIYMITFVDASNNESNKSPSSEFVTVINGVTPVSLYHSETIPAGVTKKRLYRQNVVITNGLIVADDANWKLVSENSASATSATDTYADASIPGTALNAALRGLPPSPVGTPNTNAVLPDGGTPESRVYVYTLVSAYDEEGPPSDATAVVSCDPTKTVTLTVPVTPGGSYNLVKKRIYRSATGTAKTMFQFVGEVAAAVTTFADNVLTANLQELLKSAGWIPPPANLTGLRVMANGSAVGFAGNTVYLSEPNQPHAWPNIYPFDEDIIGIGTFGQSVAVLTKRYPYILQGVDPAAMTSTKLDLPQVCANKRSIVETGDGVLFASPDGLVMIGANTSIVTQNLIPRANWQAYNPASMECFLYNGRVIITYTNVSAVRGALILDLTGQGAVLTASDFNQTVATTAGFYSPERDTLYFVQNSQIVRFDAGITQMASVWRSKTFRMPAPVCLAFGQVRATTYPVTIKVYADGVLKTTKAVADAKQFRLPSGFKALDWEFQLEGSVEVNEVFLTTSTVELQNA